MAIRTEQIALRGLRPEALARHAPVADLEVLGPRVAVVELERSRRAFVAASLTATTPGRDQLVFECSTALLLVPIGLGVAATPTLLDQFGTRSEPGRCG